MEMIGLESVNTSFNEHIALSQQIVNQTVHMVLYHMISKEIS